MEQRQDSLKDQLRDLVAIANQHGMYDAADYLAKLTSDRIPRCHAAVPRKAKDYTGPVPLLPGTPDNELVVDQCRKAAAEGSDFCGQHRAVVKGSVALCGDFDAYL